MATPKTDGSPRFAAFIEEMKREGREYVEPRPEPEVRSGYVEEVSADSVLVKLDGSSEQVTAKKHGFPADWQYQVGDVLGVQGLESGWRTVIVMAKIQERQGRTDFYARNRDARELRLLGSIENR